MSALLRFLGGVAVAGLVASSASASPSPAPSAVFRVRDVGLTFNPTDIQLAPLSHVITKRMTNAERFARGLNPNKPHRRSPGQLRARASPTPTSSAAPESSAAEPSSAIPAPPSSSAESFALASSAASSSAAPPAATCSSVPGRISATNNQQPNGYVSAVPNSFGEYGPTADASAALQVSLELCTGDTSSTPHSITTVNGLSAYPILAGILGFASVGTSLTPGSTNYAYIGGTATEVPAGSPAQNVPNSFTAASGRQEGVETAIWLIDSATGAITPQWINADGSVSTPTIVYVPGADAYALISDFLQFTSTYGAAYITELSFVSSSVTAPATTSVV